MKSDIDILETDQAYINRWTVSYADFITMLLALFMTLYALSNADLEAFKAFSGSVNKAFDKKITNKESSDSKTAEPYKKSKISELFSTTKTAVYIDGKNIFEPDKASKELRKYFADFENLLAGESERFNNIEQKIINNIDDIHKEKIKILREPRGLIIRLNDRVLFSKDSGIMKSESSGIPDTIFEVVKKEPNSVRIEYMAEENGKTSSNPELSMTRVMSIYKYAVEKSGINPNRISIAGSGEYISVPEGTVKNARRENQSIDIIILSLASKIFEQGNRNTDE